MLQVITNGYESPDSYYFRTSDAEPELEQGEQSQQVLKLVNGRGTYKGSSTPQVTSTVILDAEDLVVIHVGFSHRHGGCQFYRYYRYNGQEWQQGRWAQLPDEDRQRVLIACEDRAPSWAKTPGKLRIDYNLARAIETRTSYKLVQVIDGRYFSVYDGKTEYVIGKRLAERAMSDHGGGYYSYPDAEGVEHRFYAGGLFPEVSYRREMTLALIECEISGMTIKYNNGKFASTYLRPISVLKTIEYTPELQKVG